MDMRLIIIGASAMGRETCNFARECGGFDIVGFLDSRTGFELEQDGYPPVIGSPFDYVPRPDDFFVCAIGDGRVRETYVRLLSERGGHFVSVIHPSAHIGPHVRIGCGCIVCPQVFLDCDIDVGDHVILNGRSYVSHDCRLGDFVTLSPNVSLAGRCRVGPRSFLGIAVVCRPDITVGENSIVGAGSVLTKNVPPESVFDGSPARELVRPAGRKLLLLAGADAHQKVVEAAREMGVKTIVADNLPKTKSPCKQIADVALDSDIYDIGDLASYCRANRIDGVLDFCIDPAQRPAQQLADCLGLPAFGSAEQVFSLTDKAAFKKLCGRYGVDVIPSYAVEDAMAGRVDFPIVIKPIDSRGSRGTTVCRAVGDVGPAVETARAFSSDGTVLVEKYMSRAQAQDLTITYLVIGGEPILISVGDRHSGRVEDGLDRQLICTIQPSRHVESFLRRANDRIISMIRGLGIQNGPVFFQGFWDGETVRLYDPGIRFPGNEYERSFAKVVGANPMKSVISYCVGCGMLDYGGLYRGSWEFGGKMIAQYMINVGPGRISEFSGLDRIAADPRVTDVRQKHFVGDVIEKTGDIRHRAGEISIVVDRNYNALKDALAMIGRELHVTDENGENMLISPFTPNYIDRLYGDLT